MKAPAKVIAELGKLALNLVASGRITADQADDLVAIRADDLAVHDGDVVVDAIRRYRKTKPFFPDLCDLQPIISAILAERFNPAVKKPEPEFNPNPQERERMARLLDGLVADLRKKGDQK